MTALKLDAECDLKVSVVSTFRSQSGARLYISETPTSETVIPGRFEVMKMKNRSDSHTLGALEGLLDALVKDRVLATYGYVAEHVGRHPHSASLWALICDVIEKDANAGRALRSSLVVNVNTDRPGKQYYAKAREVGILVGDDEQSFWESQLERLGLPVKAPILRPIY